MVRSFEALIAEHGLPQLVVPNTPLLRTCRDGVWGTFRSHPVRRVEPAAAAYHRIPFGAEPYLLVRAHLEVPLAGFDLLLAELDHLEVLIVEFRREGGDRARLTLSSDVTPLSHQGLAAALAAGRVLSVSDWQSRGDCRAQVAFATAESIADEDGHHFCFPEDTTIPPAQLPALAEGRESTAVFWRRCRELFTRGSGTTRAGVLHS